MVQFKMASEVVVVDNVLCFLVARFGKTGNKQLTSTVLDFYEFSDIYQAKRHLLDVVEQWKSEVNLPHIPVRREGEQRHVKTLDDIITILTCLDEHLKLNYLPKYVAISPDAMPSTRIYDGDLLTLMTAFDKLRGRVIDVEAMVSAILKTVNTTNEMLMTTAVQSAPVMSSSQAQAQTFRSAESVINSVRHQDSSAGRVMPMPSARATEIESGPAGNSHQDSETQRVNTVRDWAYAVETVPVPVSAQLPLQNRFLVLSRDQGDDDNVYDVSDSNEFTEQRSRRSKRRRYHSRQQQEVSAQSQQQQQQQSVNDRQNSQNTGNSKQRSGRGLLTGKLKHTVPGQRFMAARNIIKKAVFCIDNVHPSVEVDDLRLFVAGLSVQVVSCFAVKPRRRRDESEVESTADRKAFRLCIAASDRDRLLDESKWPESIVISEWYHINPARERRPAVFVSAATTGCSTSAAHTSTAATAGATTVASGLGLPSPSAASPSVVPADDVGDDDDAMDHSCGAAVDDSASDTTILCSDGGLSN